MGKPHRVRLTGLAAANAEDDKLQIFVNFRDQTFSPKITPRYLELFLSKVDGGAGMDVCIWNMGGRGERVGMDR